MKQQIQCSKLPNARTRDVHRSQIDTSEILALEGNELLVLVGNLSSLLLDRLAQLFLVLGQVLELGLEQNSLLVG